MAVILAHKGSGVVYQSLQVRSECAAAKEANLAVVYAGDEAGDISFNFNKGATRYFVVALIGTQSPDELRAGLETFRLEHSLGAHTSFPFTNSLAWRC